MEPAARSATGGTRMRRASAALLAVTVLNLLASYLREMLVAAIYGASAVTDAYFSAYSLAMTLSDLLLGAALLTSFVPAMAPIVEEAGETRDRRRNLVGVASLATVVVAGLLGMAAWILMTSIMQALLPGSDAATQAMAVAYGRVLVWLLPILGLSLLFQLALNAHGEFALPALSWPVINLVFVSLVASFGHPGEGGVLATAALLGPLAAAMLLGWRLSRLGLLPVEWPKLATEDARLLWRLARPMLVTLGLGSSVGLLMVSQLLLRRYASGFGEGAISALGYAFRIYEVPVTLAANTAGILLLPAVSKLHAAEDRESIAALCRNAMLWGAILLAPAAVVAWVEADWIIDILLHRGRFSAEAATMTADALRGFAPAILFEAALVVFYRIFYAMRRPLLPVAASVASLLSLLLLLEATGLWGSFILVPMALSASFAVALIVQTGFLVHLLGRQAMPKTGTFLIPLALAVIGGGLWLALRTSPSTPHALIGMALFGMAYAVAACLFMPVQRGQLFAILRHRGATDGG